MSTPIDQLMRQADPVDAYDLPPATGREGDALYAAILERTRMDAPAERLRRRRRVGPLLAAAAFVVVLVVVGIVALFSSTGADRDVVDEPPPVPSSSLAPPTTAPPQEDDAATTTTAAATTTTDPDANPLPDYPLGPPFSLRTIAADVVAGHASLSLDAEGRLYAGDWDFSSRINRVGVDGSVETWAETELLQSAHSSAFGPDGRLYVTSTGNGHLLAFSGDGSPEVVTDQLSRPTGILFLPDGRLLVADAGPNAIFEVLPDGSVVDFARHRFFHEPQGLALDDAGNVYVSNFVNGRLQRISPAGEVEELHQFDDALNGLLYLDGAVYIAGRGDWVIFRYVLENGAVEMVADAGGEALSMFAPVSLAAGPDGAIYLSYETPTSVGVLTPVG